MGNDLQLLTLQWYEGIPTEQFCYSLSVQGSINYAVFNILITNRLVLDDFAQLQTSGNVLGMYKVGHIKL